MQGKKRMFRMLAICAALVFAVHAVPAQGYDTGRKWPYVSSTWPQYRVYVDYTPLTSSWRTVAYNSRMQWNNVGASKQYFYYSDSSGTHEIRMANYGNTGWLGSTLALGSPLYDADTKLNSYYPLVTATPTSTQYDGQSVITHELGHWLELNHSSVSYATMSPGLPAGSTWMRTLATDDISGIRALYGAK